MQRAENGLEVGDRVGSSPWPVVSIVLAWAAFGLGTYQSAADEPHAAVHFVRHDVNPASRFPACAAIDVNADGKLDIVSGGFWYAAPSWEGHFLRDVERIRGRFDDYANLPLDVDGDGWTDIVSANYRSQSIYWVRNPGPQHVHEPGTGWERRVIAKPGPMETGRLVDVDGDGQLDILPNGVRFAAWWEIDRGASTSGTNPDSVRFVRHDLPDEAAGHGLGFADLNADGRGDLITANGWLEAPADRRRGRWKWHPDFRLPRDCSIPILVWDVDGDGDRDIVWGRGHNIGLYWLQQDRARDGRRRWRHHTIDSSWSEPHSILLADVDNDGRSDLIAGKRYMGHDGKDPGEYDPLAIYWYRFDVQRRTWERHPVSFGGGAALGLDPKAVDLDQDGDIDILAPDRSGLFYFENRLIVRGTPATKVERAPARLSTTEVPYPDSARLLEFRTADNAVHPVRGPLDWAQRRHHILLNMQKVMGPLPEPARRIPLDVKRLSEVEREGYLEHRISFASEPGDRVPALLLIPAGIDLATGNQRAPAMLCLHQTVRIGKGSPAGLGDRPSLHYARELAQRGYICLVPDYPSFGDYPYDFARQGSHYRSGTMKAIWNNLRAVDLLESLPITAQDKIGCIGHSLGGHNGLFTAVFDQRIRAVVTSCGFTPFHDYYGGKLAGWTSPRYMPLIRETYSNDPDLVPFDFYEVIAALAPRHVFINAPVEDGNFAVAGVRKVVAAAGPVFDLLGAGDNLQVVYPESQHDFPDPVRRQAYEWLDKVFR